MPVLIEGIQYGYRRKGIFPIETILSRLGERFVEFDGDRISIVSERYYVFSTSLTCVSCGLTGSYFAKEQTHRKTGITLDWHFNLYAIQLDPWREVLMTKDHIVPVSLGGEDDLDNLQTMCAPCNIRKGNGSKNVQIKNGLPPKEQWDGMSPEITRADFRIFRREFTRLLLDNLGWNQGSDTSCEG